MATCHIPTGWLEHMSAFSIKTYIGDLSQSLHATQPTNTSLSHIRHGYPMVLECMHAQNSRHPRPGMLPLLPTQSHLQTQTGTDIWSQNAHTLVSNNCTVGLFLFTPVGETSRS